MYAYTTASDHIVSVLIPSICQFPFSSAVYSCIPLDIPSLFGYDRGDSQGSTAVALVWPVPRGSLCMRTSTLNDPILTSIKLFTQYINYTANIIICVDSSPFFGISVQRYIGMVFSELVSQPHAIHGINEYHNVVVLILCHRNGDILDQDIHCCWRLFVVLQFRLLIYRHSNSWCDWTHHWNCMNNHRCSRCG